MPAPINFVAPCQLINTDLQTLDFKVTTAYVDTSGGGIKTFMPLVPHTGERHWFKDFAATFGLHTFTLDGNGYNLETPFAPGVFASQITLTKNGQAALYEFDFNEQWRILCLYSP